MQGSKLAEEVITKSRDVAETLIHHGGLEASKHSDKIIDEASETIDSIGGKFLNLLEDFLF